MPERVIVSVRGDAERTVAPDYVVVHCSIRAIADSKVGALEQLATAQQTLLNGLTELGGTPFTVQTRRAALTWSISSVGTGDEHDVDKATGRHGPTGRVIANATAVITSRELARLDDLGRALTSVANLHFEGIAWRVDAENEHWRGCALGRHRRGHREGQGLRGSFGWLGDARRADRRRRVAFRRPR